MKHDLIIINSNREMGIKQRLLYNNSTINLNQLSDTLLAIVKYAALLETKK